ITDPVYPSPAGSLIDSGFANTLAGASDVDTFTIGASTYAIVAAFNDNGVQIIDISDPVYPSPAGKLIDNGFATALAGASGVDTFTLTGTYAGTYAIVASKGDNAVQIIDVSNPYNIVAGGALTDDIYSLVLQEPKGVDTFTVGSSTYAIVASFGENGVQIIDVSNPENISATISLTDDLHYSLRMQGVSRRLRLVLAHMP
ncbi:hypothetical protein HX849_00775, partial [Marine Group I thaumarchaeote]|nr:hypothetical protein [Marine Group I thaumarchaeote]